MPSAVIANEANEAPLVPNLAIGDDGERGKANAESPEIPDRHKRAATGLGENERQPRKQRAR
jgi:hypothetical protein